MPHSQSTLILLLCLGICSSTKINLYQQNCRVTDVKFTKSVRSLLECTVVFKRFTGSVSFNYIPTSKMCELSDVYPENSTVSEIGSMVYSYTVDGSWTAWLQWDSCTATCSGGVRTRTRACENPSPSNGGRPCAGNEYENAVCNTQQCQVIPDYFISTNALSWFDAEASCNEMSGQLLIIDNLAEQDYVESLVGGELEYWIGLRCLQNNCTWVDGRSIDGGFINWAPAEPGNRECVWLGYYFNKWDDDYCEIPRKYICEF